METQKKDDTPPWKKVNVGNVDKKIRLALRKPNVKTEKNPR